MQMTNPSIDSTGSYTRTAIALHWLLALMLPVQIGLGWYMLSVEKEPGSETLFALHISIGLTIALLLALRVVWRAANRPAALPANVASWEVKAARLSHLLLYLLMILLPVTGYLALHSAVMRSAISACPCPAGRPRTNHSRNSFSQCTESSPGRWWGCLQCMC